MTQENKTRERSLAEDISILLSKFEDTNSLIEYFKLEEVRLASSWCETHERLSTAEFS